MRFFVSFLRRHFAIGDDAFAVSCNLFADHLSQQAEIESFSLEALGLPESCLRKSTVNVYSKYSQKQRRNMLLYGTCRVTVHRTHVVQAILGPIQEYGGFDRPE